MESYKIFTWTTYLSDNFFNKTEMSNNDEEAETSLNTQLKEWAKKEKIKSYRIVNMEHFVTPIIGGHTINHLSRTFGSSVKYIMHIAYK